MGQVSKVAKRYAAVVVAALALVAVLVAGGTAFNTPRAYAADVHVSTQDELQQAIYDAGTTPTTIIVDGNITTDGNSPAWFKEHQGTVPVPTWVANGDSYVDLTSEAISRNERYAFKVGSDAQGNPVQQDITILPAAGSGQITFTDSVDVNNDWWGKITGAFRVENNSKLTVGGGAGDPCIAPADTFAFTGFYTIGNGGNGAVFNVQEGSELVLNHATLSWNGVYDNFVTPSSSTPQMFNSELSRGATIYPSGGAIYGAPGSSITINGGSINNNHASWNGGAISIGTATTETIVGSEGTLWDTSTKANDEGFVWWTSTSQPASTLVINGTSITNNEANNSGGAIYLGPNVNAQITSAQIDTNTAKGADVDGAGAPQDFLYLLQNGQSYAIKTSGHVGGGGLFVSDGATVALVGSTVDNNTAENAKVGGGITASGASIVSVDSTSISGNKNTTNTDDDNGGSGSWGKGGGIGVFASGANEGHVAINSGTIANNTAPGQGGGVYADPYTTMYVNNGYVTDNYAGIAGGGIAYCYFGSTDAINNAYAAVFDNSTGTSLGRDLADPNKEPAAGGVVLNGSVYGRDGAVTWFHDGNMVADAGEAGAFGWSSPTEGNTAALDANDFETNADGVEVLKRGEYQVLRAELDPAAKDFIEANKQVVITGNRSDTHGGGLAINGRMHFNTSPISVEKKWVDEDGNAITWPQGAEVKLTVQKVAYAQPVQGCDAGQAASSDATTTDVSADPKILKVNPDTNKVAVYDENGNLISENPLAVWENLPYVSPADGYYTVKEEVTGMSSGQNYTQEFEGNAYTTLALSNVEEPKEEPEIEKFVNDKVHDEVDLAGEFTYSIFAYVTNDADKVTITDELVGDLQFDFAEADADTKVTVEDWGEGKKNNPPAATAAKGANAIGSVVATKAVSGQKLTVTIANELEEVKDADGNVTGVTNTENNQNVTPLRGHWVKVTFDAKYAENKKVADVKKNYVNVKEDEVYKANPDAENRATPNVGNDPTGVEGSHEGTPNTASYDIEVGNKSSYSDESNTVTVKPVEPTIEKYVAKDVHAEVEIGQEYDYDILVYVPKNADSIEINDTLEPTLSLVSTKADIEGSVVVKKTNNHTVNGTVASSEVSDATVSAVATISGQSIKVEIADAAPARGQYVQVTFKAKVTADATHVPIDDNGTVLEGAASHEGIPNDATYKIKVGNAWSSDYESNTVTVKPKEEEPAIEKYVNKDVHKDIEIAEPFTYDVIAYITKDADKVEIYDELVEDLEFASAEGDVAVVDLGTNRSNHKTDGDYTGTNADATVSAAGTPLAASVATPQIDGQKLTVTIADATALRGHWVKVTFDAKIKAGKAIADLSYSPITKNDPVVSVKAHTGVPNTAEYTIFVDNAGKYNLESNTVTVKPKGVGAEIDLLVTKIMRNNATGTEETPEAGAFTFKLELTDPNGAKSNLEASNTENGGTRARFKLTDLDTPGEYTYKVTEVVGDNADIAYDTSELSGSFYVAELKMKQQAAAQILSMRTHIANPFAFAITPFAPSADETDMYDTYFAVVDKATYDQYEGVAQIESTDDIDSIKLAELAVGSFTNERGGAQTLSAEASTVTKTWADGGNTKDRDDVEFQLYRKVGEGAWEAVQGQTVTLTSENENGLTTWTGRFENLPAYEGGQKISYRAVEANSADFEGLYTPDAEEEIIIVDVDSTSGMGATNHPFTPNTSVEISKQAVGGGPELPGATLIVRDASGNEVARWVSGTDPHSLTLEPGVYTLTEITAPNGYDVAETMTFRVNVDGTVELLQNGQWLSVEDHIVMFDAPTTPGTPDQPNTPTPGRPSNPGTPTTSRTPTPTSSAKTADAVGGATVALLLAAVLGAGGVAYAGSRSRASRKK